MDKDNIETCYKGATNGKKHIFFPNQKTVIAWSFIVKKMMKSIIFISHVLNY